MVKENKEMSYKNCSVEGRNKFRRATSSSKNNIHAERDMGRDKEQREQAPLWNDGNRFFRPKWLSLSKLLSTVLLFTKSSLKYNRGWQIPSIVAN